MSLQQPFLHLVTYMIMMLIELNGPIQTPKRYQSQVIIIDIGNINWSPKLGNI